MVGSGAGGATAAKELQGHYQVTVLEEGREFKPFRIAMETLKFPDDWACYLMSVRSRSPYRPTRSGMRAMR